jgi:hypothetical protein
MNVGQDGSVSITAKGSVSFTATGTMGLDGVLSTTGDVLVYAWFNPDFSGRWYYGDYSGSLSESGPCSSD